MREIDNKQKVRDNEHFRFSSAKNYIKFFVLGFAFRHDNQFKGKDKFVGRELQFRKLFLWLTSDSLSGSFLVTGYRGMGKSVLVSRVLHNISRSLIQWLEFPFKAVKAKDSQGKKLILVNLMHLSYRKIIVPLLKGAYGKGLFYCEVYSYMNNMHANGQYHVTIGAL